MRDIDSHEVHRRARALRARAIGVAVLWLVRVWHQWPREGLAANPAPPQRPLHT